MSAIVKSLLFTHYVNLCDLTVLWKLGAIEIHLVNYVLVTYEDKRRVLDFDMTPQEA